MILSRLRMAALIAPTALIAGCGHAADKRTLSLQQVPLVPGAKVLTQLKACDRGNNAFCALELVIVDPAYKTSNDLEKAEHRWVHAAGWKGVGGDTTYENAAESPGHRLRVTYATALDDLRALDLGVIHRPPKIALAMSRAIFSRQPAMSLLLESGDSS
jgi:hypothetical protein